MDGGNKKAWWKSIVDRFRKEPAALEEDCPEVEKEGSREEIVEVLKEPATIPTHEPEFQFPIHYSSYLPGIWARMARGMTYHEQKIAIKLVQELPHGGTTPVVAIAKSVGVSPSLASTTVMKLIMAGVISTAGRGVLGTEITVLDPHKWNMVGEFDPDRPDNLTAH